jgi:hypothetical protein
MAIFRFAVYFIALSHRRVLWKKQYALYRCQRHGRQVANFTSSSFADALVSRPSINAVRSSRVRCEVGILIAMGCCFAELAKACSLNSHPRRTRPAKFPAPESKLLDSNVPGNVQTV